MTSSYMTSDTHHMYRPSNFNPFIIHGKIPYGPRSTQGCVPSGYQLPHDSKEHFYASSGSSWTTSSNVTPGNGITYGTHMTPMTHDKKEAYSSSANSWRARRPYTC